MTKILAIAALAMGCLTTQGAGIQAEHVRTSVDEGHERVQVGRWTQDSEGRTRYELDDWTQIVDPVEGVTWRANSKRGRYSKARIVQPSRSPLIDLRGSLDGPNSREVWRIDLGTREIDGVECKGTLVDVALSGSGVELRIEVEAWMTEAFGFPFNVEFVLRSANGEGATRLRNIVEVSDSEAESTFRPPEDWKESRFALTRANVVWTGFWPFVRPGSKVTAIVGPWPRIEPRRQW